MVIVTYRDDQGEREKSSAIESGGEYQFPAEERQVPGRSYSTSIPLARAEAPGTQLLESHLIWKADTGSIVKVFHEYSSHGLLKHDLRESFLNYKYKVHRTQSMVVHIHGLNFCPSFL